MLHEFQGPFDRLAAPIPKGWGNRGRPAHIPAHENLNKVRLLLACVWINERIGQALTITATALAKYYFPARRPRGRGGKIPATRRDVDRRPSHVFMAANLSKTFSALLFRRAVLL